MMDMEEIELLNLILQADTREDLDKARAAVVAWREKHGISKAFEDRHDIVLASEYELLLKLYKLSLRSYCNAANEYSSCADITPEEAHERMCELLAK